MEQLFCNDSSRSDDDDDGDDDDDDGSDNELCTFKGSDIIAYLLIDLLMHLLGRKRQITGSVVVRHCGTFFHVSYVSYFKIKVLDDLKFCLIYLKRILEYKDVFYGFDSCVCVFIHSSHTRPSNHPKVVVYRAKPKSNKRVRSDHIASRHVTNKQTNRQTDKQTNKQSQLTKVLPYYTLLNHNNKTKSNKQQYLKRHGPRKIRLFSRNQIQ